MKLFNMFRTPYLDEVDTGGGAATESTVQAETTISEEGQQQTQQTQQTQTAPSSIKIKFNHEEKEIPYEEAVTHIQKGMNYDKAVERAKQEARDAWVAEQGYEWNGKPIKTEAEYKQALNEQKLAEKIKAQYDNVPDEIVQQLLKVNELEQWKTQTEQQRQEQEAKSKSETEKQQRIQRENAEFEKLFKAENGRDFDFNSAEDTKIFIQLGALLKQGFPLDYAYSRHLLDAHHALKQTQNANSTNASSSTGSARTNGQTGSFFTREQVSNMSRSEIQENYNAIKESEKHWK